MPGKFEVMRAVRDRLDNLKIAADAPDGCWFPLIATELCDLGRNFGCTVCASRVADANRDRPEWLYDVTWLEYERGGGRLVNAPLVAECEWKTGEDLKYIIEDFEKLLLARAGVRLMIFTGSDQSEEIAKQLARRVREFNGSRAEDAWLLAAWEGNPEAWSFRYFTITPATGILRSFDT